MTTARESDRFVQEKQPFCLHVIFFNFKTLVSYNRIPSVQYAIIIVNFHLLIQVGGKFKNTTIQGATVDFFLVIKNRELIQTMTANPRPIPYLKNSQ